MFRVGFQSYFRIVTSRMKRSTFRQHKEVAMLCEVGMTTAKARSALSIPQNTTHVTPLETQSNIRKINKFCTNCGMTNHNVETCRKKKE